MDHHSKTRFKAAIRYLASLPEWKDYMEFEEMFERETLNKLGMAQHDKLVFVQGQYQGLKEFKMVRDSYLHIEEKPNVRNNR